MLTRSRRLTYSSSSTWERQRDSMNFWIWYDMTSLMVIITHSFIINTNHLRLPIMQLSVRHQSYSYHIISYHISMTIIIHTFDACPSLRSSEMIGAVDCDRCWWSDEKVSVDKRMSMIGAFTYKGRNHKSE